MKNLKTFDVLPNFFEMLTKLLKLSEIMEKLSELFNEFERFSSRLFTKSNMFFF